MVFFIIALIVGARKPPRLPKEYQFMQFHPFARRFLALVLTAAFMTTAALSGFAVYAMPIQAAYSQESIYLFDADTGEALVEQNPDLPAALPA